MDLGSALGGMGCPVVVRTDRFVCRAPACLRLAAEKESEDLPRVVRIRAGLKTQAMLAVQTSSPG